MRGSRRGERGIILPTALIFIILMIAMIGTLLYFNAKVKSRVVESSAKIRTTDIAVGMINRAVYKLVESGGTYTGESGTLQEVTGDTTLPDYINVKIEVYPLKQSVEEDVYRIVAKVSEQKDMINVNKQGVAIVKVKKQPLPFPILAFVDIEAKGRGTIQRAPWVSNSDRNTPLIALVEDGSGGEVELEGRITIGDGVAIWADEVELEGAILGDNVEIIVPDVGNVSGNIGNATVTLREPLDLSTVTSSLQNYLRQITGNDTINLDPTSPNLYDPSNLVSGNLSGNQSLGSLTIQYDPALVNELNLSIDEIGGLISNLINASPSSGRSDSGAIGGSWNVIILAPDRYYDDIDVNDNTILLFVKPGNYYIGNLSLNSVNGNDLPVLLLTPDAGLDPDEYFGSALQGDGVKLFVNQLVDDQGALIGGNAVFNPVRNVLSYAATGLNLNAISDRLPSYPSSLLFVVGTYDDGRGRADISGRSLISGQIILRDILDDELKIKGRPTYFGGLISLDPNAELEVKGRPSFYFDDPSNTLVLLIDSYVKEVSLEMISTI